MMSYGPQLPPNMQKPRVDSSDEDEDDDQMFGPKLPDIPCRGPKPPSEDEGEVIGPKLPDQPCRGPKPGTSGSAFGPELPSSWKAPVSDEDDDDVIGPRPPNPDDAVDMQTLLARQFEDRAEKMRMKLAGNGEDAGPAKREKWMLELPPALTKNFGLGPRSFSSSTGPKPQQDKSWTRAPTDSVLATAGNDDNDPQNDDQDVVEYMASLKRDVEMERVANELREKRGTESLMDRHSKKIKKEKEKDSSKAKERRPFDRDVDLQANRFDEAQKKAMLKKASQLDDRFAAGNQKFL